MRTGYNVYSNQMAPKELNIIKELTQPTSFYSMFIINK